MLYSASLEHFFFFFRWTCIVHSNAVVYHLQTLSNGSLHHNNSVWCTSISQLQCFSEYTVCLRHWLCGTVQHYS